MNNSAKSPRSFYNILEDILHRTGEWYLLWVIIFAQIASSVGAFAAEYTIRMNADFSPSELYTIIKLGSGGILAANFGAFAIAFFYYADVRQALKDALLGKKELSPDKSFTVWNKITSLSWQYTLFLALITIPTAPLPLLLFRTSIKLNPDQIIYLLLGSAAAILGISVILFLLLDRLLIPVYEILQPKKREDEKIIRSKGLSISIKLQSIILAIILFSIFLTVPIGYHHTKRAIGFGNSAILKEMQVQSLVITIAAIILGVIISFILTRSVASPLQELIRVFSRIEAGKIHERATLQSSDESGELTIYFNQMIAQLDNLQSSLEAQIAQRTEQLKATSEVGQAASSILDPNELIEKVVNLITERLGYYYAAIFLISPDGYWAELKSATGEAGAALKEKGHRLSVNGMSMVGSAINLRKARIAHDVGAEAVRFDNPYLPYTRSEIALPLVAGGHVLGALDAQSMEENAFDEDVVETLQAMANQVAIALENARLFQETQKALREIQSAQRKQLADAWEEEIETQNSLEYSTGERKDNNNEVSVPLSLREQIIGEISLAGGPEWITEEQEWLEAVATQAALALENARLLEESQQVALQERLIAEITSKVWSSRTTEEILKVALNELGSALGASEASVELSPNKERGRQDQMQ